MIGFPPMPITRTFPVIHLGVMNPQDAPGVNAFGFTDGLEPILFLGAGVFPQAQGTAPSERQRAAEKSAAIEHTRIAASLSGERILKERSGRRFHDLRRPKRQLLFKCELSVALSWFWNRVVGRGITSEASEIKRPHLRP